jgi:hypothetical protein
VKICASATRPLAEVRQSARFTRALDKAAEALKCVRFCEIKLLALDESEMFQLNSAALCAREKSRATSYFIHLPKLLTSRAKFLARGVSKEECNFAVLLRPNTTTILYFLFLYKCQQQLLGPFLQPTSLLSVMHTRTYIFYFLLC